LFAPTTAWRVRWDTNSDTPLPPDEPAAPNPPEGAILNYYLKSAASGPVTIEILHANGRVVRRYSSADPAAPLPDPSTSSLPLYWYRPPQALSAAAGMHRFMWDVHYQPLGARGQGGGGLPSAAVPYNTAPAPSTPWVAPGTYTVKLTVNGRSFTQPIAVTQDPRVKTPESVMQQVYSQTEAMYFGAVDAQAAAASLAAIRAQVAKLQPQAQGTAVQALADFDRKAEALQGAAPGAAAGGRGARGRAGGPDAAAPAPETLSAAGTSLSSLMNSLQAADVQPTAIQVTAITAALQAAERVMARWTALKTADLPALNATLKAAGLAEIRVQ
jgi:hypothetical protein